MKFTLSWLKDHLDTDAPVEKIADRDPEDVIHLLLHKRWPSAAEKSAFAQLLRDLSADDDTQRIRVGRITVIRILTSVDLPAPLGPSSPKISPRPTCISIPRSACTLPR